MKSNEVKKYLEIKFEYVLPSLAHFVKLDDRPPPPIKSVNSVLTQISEQHHLRSCSEVKDSDQVLKIPMYFTVKWKVSLFLILYKKSAPIGAWKCTFPLF